MRSQCQHCFCGVYLGPRTYFIWRHKDAYIMHGFHIIVNYVVLEG